MYLDESNNKNGRGAGIILEGLEGITIEHSLCFDFQMRNDQVEYEALIASLKLVKDIGVQSLRAKSES